MIEAGSTDTKEQQLEQTSGEWTKVPGYHGSLLHVNGPKTETAITTPREYLIVHELSNLEALEANLRAGGSALQGSSSEAFNPESSVITSIWALICGQCEV